MAKKSTTKKTKKVSEKKATQPKAEKATKTKAPRAPKAPKADGKLSQIEAALKVLAETKEPMTTKQMVEAMAAKGYWTSPGGKTPHATLYSAILREIQAKGSDARFAKVDRGQFKLAQ